MIADLRNYEGREQAYVKHFFLESYLESLVFKTASAYRHVAYVDGFSGPWQSQGENFEDTSFGIALAALRKAKAAWKEQGKEVKMSAHLVERSRTAYAELENIKARFPDIEIHTYNGEFVSTAPALIKDIPPEAFAFLFVDPKGWRIDIQKLAPLLSRANSEVVFNFMFEFVNRAASINDPAIIDGLNELMPHGDWKGEIAALEAAAPKARVTILANAFRETLRTIGKYGYVAEVPVLRPLKDRVLYWLFYGTRHTKGIEVFRGCHLKTEREQSAVRQEKKRSHEASKSNQDLLFPADVPLGPDETESLLSAERDAAQATLLKMAPSAIGSVTYGDLWPRVLEKHVVTLPDLNKIANDLRKSGRLQFPDWEARKRSPSDAYRIARSH